MGDMGDYYRAWEAAKKRRKSERMTETDSTGWTKHTEFHWSKMVAGKRLDYWPSTGKFQHGGGKVMKGDFRSVNGFITNREREAS